MTIVLGIDLATAEVRVQAVDVATGQTVAGARAALPLRNAAGSGPAGARVQPPDHGRLARELITAVGGRLGARAKEVRGLSITGTSGTVVPADARGRPVGDAVLYDDPRGADQLRRLVEAGIARRPVAALARAAWMHGVAPAARYLFTPDIVAADLSGRLLPSDTSHALKSGIDPVSARWDETALAVLGLPVERMPELVRPGTRIGEVADPAQLGLPDGVVIVAGMTDGSTGQLATGAVAEGDTVGVLGTTLVLKAVSRFEVLDSVSGVYSHGAPDGLFWPGGASNTGAGVLRQGLTAGLDPAEAADAVAAHGPSEVVAYPLLRRGERFPLADPVFEGFSIDLAGRAREAATPVERFRTVYEGVALVERLGLERLGALGVERSRHHLAGGASASRVWNSIRASALGHEVVVAQGAGSARGAAVIAAAAVGTEPLQVIAERFAGVRTVVDPDAALVPALDDRYRVLCERLAPSPGRGLADPADT